VQSTFDQDEELSKSLELLILIFVVDGQWSNSCNYLLANHFTRHGHEAWLDCSLFFRHAKIVERSKFKETNPMAMLGWQWVWKFIRFVNFHLKN
jgi:hypothetical protein